ncbi:MAG: trypsin-like serine protease [Myxococcota bacterium]
MRKNGAVLMVCVSLTGCALEDLETDVATVESGEASTIRFGDETSALPAVGFLVNEAAGTVCTGTLINRDVVLTAAHCVAGAQARELTFTTKAAGPYATGDFHRGSSLRVHPEYRETDGSSVKEDGHPSVSIWHDGADLALLKLGKRFGGLEYPALDTTEAPVGAAVRIMGYGQDETGTAGVGRKRSGQMDVRTLVDGPQDADSWYHHSLLALETRASDQVTCPGDSGGPSIRVVEGQPRVAGVASFITTAEGNGEACGRAVAAYYTSVAAFAPWIRATRSALSPPGSCAGDDDARFSTHWGGCRDRANNLVWARLASARTRTAAVQYCDQLIQGGHSDWRLPTRAELTALAQHGGRTHISNVGTSYYWSRSLASDGRGITVRISDGNAAGTSRTAERRVLCVRG